MTPIMEGEGETRHAQTLATQRQASKQHANSNIKVWQVRERNEVRGLG